MPFGTLQRLFRHEAASGVALMLASALAVVLANSPFVKLYDLLLNVHGSVRIDGFGIDKPMLLWINDGLMAIFFLLVGLEVKREVLEGELSDRRRAILPVAAAIGGMTIPALIYLGVTRHEPEAITGWAIPCETDIAFSLGVMTLFGNRVTTSLRLFLTALAIIDDLGAIVIIAAFYTEELSWVSLDVALAALAILVMLNLAGVRRVIWYVLVGIVLWVFVVKSGVHATLAGWRWPLRSHSRRGCVNNRRLYASNTSSPHGSGSASCPCSASPMPGYLLPTCRCRRFSSRFPLASPPACFSASRSAYLAGRRWLSARAGPPRPRVPGGWPCTARACSPASVSR